MVKLTRGIKPTSQEEPTIKKLIGGIEILTAKRFKNRKIFQPHNKNILILKKQHENPKRMATSTRLLGRKRLKMEVAKMLVALKINCTISLNDAQK